MLLRRTATRANGSTNRNSESVTEPAPAQSVQNENIEWRLKKEHDEVMELDKARDADEGLIITTRSRIAALLDTLTDQRNALAAATQRLALIKSKRATVVSHMLIHTDSLPNVRIYILCHNEERFESAKKSFQYYYWAVPILMKYQNLTFENAFWKQLLELKSEWENCRMVGVLSSRAPSKVSIMKIDSIITNPSTWKGNYYNFYDSDKPIAAAHPYLIPIVKDVTTKLHLPVPTDNWCNYWMCSPEWMCEFIQWYETVLSPTVLTHPLSMSDAKYKGTLSAAECQALCGVPYYPHAPFVIERINKSFFMIKQEHTKLPKVRLYVLCHNEERYALATEKFAKYYWAKPILMKYQDCTFENAFWKQLGEIQHEWETFDMVGTLSPIADKKVNLSDVDTIIKNKDLWDSPVYHHFMQYDRPIDFSRHPHMETIIRDTCTALGKKLPKESYCNYWMCRPSLMIQFIQWVQELLIPTVNNHPLSMTDSNYIEGSLTPEQCTVSFGVPYYPQVPFILERLTSLFCSTRIILVSHENSKTGAPLMLENLYNYLISKGHYATLIYHTKETMPYILKEATYWDTVVVCNTLVTHNVVKECRASNIPVLWYIHEWLDAAYLKHYPFLIENKQFYLHANRLIFPCMKSWANHNLYAEHDLSEISDIIPHGYDLDLFAKKQKEDITFKREPGLIYIGMVGTIDKRKNQDVFIQRVFTPLTKKYPNLRLVLIGKPHIPLLSANTNVIKIGEVANPIPYINTLDILVSYSINEVLPMNIIEACLCKKAIVASDAGGTSHIIINSETGFIVDINDHAKTIERLTQFIESPALRNQYGLAAYEKAVKEYDQDTTFSTFERTILNVLRATP